MTDLAAWVLSIGAFAGIVLCTVVAAKSVAGDPARGRRRCPRCWHELGPLSDAAGDSARRCSECGFTAMHEADTLRTRRSLRRAAFAVLGVFLIAVAAQLRIADRGFWATMPTGVVMFAAPRVDGFEYRSPAWELAWRVTNGLTTREQDLAALALLVEGDDDARPPSSEWRLKYRDLAGAVLSRFQRDDPALLRLLEIPPLIEVSSLPTSAMPHIAIVDIQAWWPPTIDGRVEIRFSDGTVRRARFDPQSRAPSLYVELPEAYAPGEAFEVLLSHRLRASIAGEDEGWTPYPPFEAKATGFVDNPRTATDGWQPVDSPTMREAVGTIFSDGLIVWRAGTPRAGLRFNHRATAGEEFEETAVGLRVEVCEDGVVRRTSRMWWRGGMFGSDPAWMPSIEDAAALARLYEQDPSLDARWTLRIRGDEALASYAIPPRSGAGESAAEAASASPRVRRWFSGTVEVPLRFERQNAVSQPRRFTPY